MTSVPAGYGAYLQADGRYTTAAISGASAAWGDKALASSIMSPIAYKADADTEVARQAQFLAGPLVRDITLVPGQRSDLLFQVVTIYADRLGYEGGAVVFVIGVAEQTNGTLLTVLKRAYT